MAKFVERFKTVTFLEMLDCEITSLGCEFLTHGLHPTNANGVVILKLDHNPIGSAGIKVLAEALAINKFLKYISLSFCEIDASGADSIA